MIRAGSLNEKIQVLGLETFKNVYGEMEDRYVLKCNTRAAVLQNSGTRTDENGETYYDYTKQFELRIYVPIDDYDHIMYDGKEYRIININRDKYQRKIVVDCEMVKK